MTYVNCSVCGRDHRAALWFVFEETADGWRKVDDSAYTFEVACSKASELKRLNGHSYCANMGGY